MRANCHAAPQRLALNAGLMVLLMVIAALLPAATIGQELTGPCLDVARQETGTLHVLTLQETRDELPGQECPKPASKPCKRISQISKNLVEKQVAALPGVIFSPPAVAVDFLQPWAGLPSFHITSSLVRRSGITRAPPVSV